MAPAAGGQNWENGGCPADSGICAFFHFPLSQGHGRGDSIPAPDLALPRNETESRLTRILAATLAWAALLTNAAFAQSIGPSTPPGAKAAAFTTFVDTSAEAPLRLEMGAVDEVRVAQAKSANSASQLKRL